MTYPYSDDYMIFNKETHRYELTEKDVLERLGINLRARINNTNAIENVLKTASLHVYSFIHSFNILNDLQDYIIAKTKTGRQLIQQAMERQLTYILVVGDLTMSTDESKRSKWFDELAEEILMRTIPEIGKSICYSGMFPYIPICDMEW